MYVLTFTSAFVISGTGVHLRGADDLLRELDANGHHSNTEAFPIDQILRDAVFPLHHAVPVPHRQLFLFSIIPLASPIRFNV